MNISFNSLLADPVSIISAILKFHIKQIQADIFVNLFPCTTQEAISLRHFQHRHGNREVLQLLQRTNHQIDPGNKPTTWPIEWCGN